MARPFTIVDQLKNGRTLAKQVDASNKKFTQDIYISLTFTENVRKEEVA